MLGGAGAAAMFLISGQLDAAASAAWWLVEKVAEKLVADTMKALAAEHGLEEEIRELRGELRRVKLVLGAARGHGEKVQRHEALAASLERIRLLAADAYNLLDELHYFSLQQQVEGTPRSNDTVIASTSRSVLKIGCVFTSQASRVLSSASSTEKVVMQQETDGRATKRKSDYDVPIDEIKKMKLDSDDEVSVQAMRKLDRNEISGRITSIVGQLHEMYDDVRRALKIENVKDTTRANERADVRESTAYPTKTEGSWREQEKIKIKRLMTSTESISKKLSILAIVGDGGLGKTTLARQVYNDPDVARHFSTRIWVYVSRTFDEVKLTQEILEYLSTNGRHETTTNFNMLQMKVEKKLSLLDGEQPQRFLLILDDMWEDEEMSRWDKLLAPLKGTPANGNMILVTTRSKSVAKMTGATEHVILDGLKEDVFWPFFKGCIFGDENYQGHGKLQKIGKVIATKLNGNPLAAKSVGTLLKRKLDESYWRRIVESEEWKLQESIEHIMPALMLSYNHLPDHLKRCFSYCALFPKGYKFSMEELVYIWIAQGYVVSEDCRVTVEEFGNDYLYDLVDRSFFQRIEEQEGNAYYLLHDLMHDMAQRVSLHDCFTIDSSECNVMSPSVRHISIVTNSAYKGEMKRNESFERKLDKIQNDEALRSLSTLMLIGLYDKNFAAKFVKVLRKLQYIRVLRLSNVEFLPSNFSKFIHLRYLQLRSTVKGRSLPATICILYHLQVLDIRFWTDLRDLPRRISNLLNLRHLLVPEAPERQSLHSRIASVGKLTSLQELTEFVVREDDMEFEVGQLEDLDCLRGSLNIYHLENVKDKEAAERANLRDKKYLRTLSLSWDRSILTPAVETEVLEGLQPNDRLEHLRIIKYGGATPSWLGTECSLLDLESLHLEDCGQCEVLPPFKKLQFLKKLFLIGMTALKEVASDLSDSDVDTGDSASETDLSELGDPSLTELKICLCPRLSSLKLHSFTSLQRLIIKQCWVLSSLEGLESLVQLRQLEVTQTSGFAAAWDSAARCLGQDFRFPLEELLIDDSSVLTAPICRMLGSLRLLSLRGDGYFLSNEVRNLTEEQEEALKLLTPLQHLAFSSCRFLSSLPTQLRSLNSLKKLWIEDCQGIKSLPEGGLPASLEELKVRECSEELKEECRNCRGIRLEID